MVASCKVHLFLLYHSASFDKTTRSSDITHSIIGTEINSSILSWPWFFSFVVNILPKLTLGGCSLSLQCLLGHSLNGAVGRHPSGTGCFPLRGSPGSFHVMVTVLFNCWALLHFMHVLQFVYASTSQGHLGRLHVFLIADKAFWMNICIPRSAVPTRGFLVHRGFGCSVL